MIFLVLTTQQFSKYFENNFDYCSKASKNIVNNNLDFVMIYELEGIELMIFRVN